MVARGCMSPVRMGTGVVPTPEERETVAEYDSHLQRAVDATSVAKDAGETDLATYLRDQLAEQDIETEDDPDIAS